MADVLRDALREEIIRGEMVPGTRLIETQLAERFGTSRTPVRTALTELVHEGLVKECLGGGLEVSEFSIEDITEIIGCRQVLEVYALEQAFPHIGDADILQLQLYISQSEVFAKRGEIDKVFELNTDFHNYLVYKSGNRRLGGILNQLMGPILLYRRITLKLGGDVDGAISRHQAIVDALEESNRQKAIAELSADVSAAADILALVIEERYRSVD
jgi:DNA-binding GntR family transcriptional regulator